MSNNHNRLDEVQEFLDRYRGRENHEELGPHETLEFIKLVLYALIFGVIIYLLYQLWKGFQQTVVQPVVDVGKSIGDIVGVYNNTMGYIVYRIDSIGLTFQPGSHVQGLIDATVFHNWIHQLVTGQISARTFWSYCGGYYSLEEVWEIWVYVNTLDPKEYQ
jgi:hypothetical protein